MKRAGITLIEMLIVASIGIVLSLTMVRWFRTLMINMQQTQRRLTNEQQAQDVFTPLIDLIKEANPGSITLLSPKGTSWGGLRFMTRTHSYALYQSENQIQWQVDHSPAKTWLTDARGLHVTVDQLQDPRMLWITFLVGKNKILFTRQIALQPPP